MSTPIRQNLRQQWPSVLRDLSVHNMLVCLINSEFNNTTEYGGKTDKYVWDQWEDEVVINVTFPPGTRGKDVDCVFHKKSLKLQKKGDEPIFDVCCATSPSLTL